MATTAISHSEVAASLADRVRGEVLVEGDEGYDDARAVWNGMVEDRPAVVVRATGAADVMAAVDAAREHDLPLGVKGGGHSVAGLSVPDGGLMIDCGEMDDVSVDPEARIVRVGAGALLGDVDHETQAFGLATPLGVASITGVAGLTLGGGIGYLSRSFGLACDNLVSADVVTADGDLVRTSETEHPDLFWAIRGGGGNFGVVTAFEFRLHEVGPLVFAGPVFHDIEDAGDVLRAYRDYMATAPDEVSCYAIFANVPPDEAFPEAYQGQTALVLVPVYAGDVEDGEGALADLRAIGEPFVDAVMAMPYTALQQAFDAGTPDGERYYFKSQFMHELTDEAIDTAVEHANPLPAPFTSVGWESMGGAIGRADPTDTAFPHREPAYNFSVFAGWGDPERHDELVAWTRAYHEAMAPHTAEGIYANYLDTDDVDEKIRAAFGPNYERLAAVKAEWDPENLFSQNKNVEPAA